MNRFENRTALVTGGGSGIGKSICIRLASEGAHVLVFDQDLNTAESTVQEILEQDGKLLFLKQTKHNGGAYTLIGGKADKGETGKEALIRESWEEAGLILRKENFAKFRNKILAF